MIAEANPLPVALVEAKPRFRGPIWTLVFLAPVIAEVLSGSTRTSILFVLLPEMMVWGVGALMCREMVRRWRAGGLSLLLLGLALSIAEEFLIQQTSIAPLPFPGMHADYGRTWGINFIWLLAMLGFESVWVVVVPVKVTELLFRKRREQAWLRQRGWMVCGVVFLLGCRIAWYGWVKQARPRLGAAPYDPPLSLVAGGLAAIAALIALAYLLRGVGGPKAEGKTAPAWLAGIVALVMGAAWFELIGMSFQPHPVEPFTMAIALGVGWAAAALALFTWWTSRRAWGDVHTFCACWGATLGCQAAPYLTIATWPRIDVIGKVVFDLGALVLFVWLGRKVRLGSD
ncbi:hypothetical protein [Occallatibacter riparius]|uniref:Uncharacterized protein n=1 Tax=Occallatibacter riparius TaxID=1002689 RepID=A0A9J7BS70_9BACT|nr:hypothetical protein [Occallatibacter riparius]UWZ85715.1 hypothetical protein MOP44_07155 [Occallatibacter riparius]